MKKKTNKKTTPQNNNTPNNPPQKENAYIKKGNKYTGEFYVFYWEHYVATCCLYPLMKCSLWPTPQSLVISFDEMFPVTYPLVPWYAWLRMKVKTDPADAFRWFCAHPFCSHAGHWLVPFTLALQCSLHSCFLWLLHFVVVCISLRVLCGCFVCPDQMLL